MLHGLGREEKMIKWDCVDSLKKSLPIQRPINRVPVKYQSDILPVSDDMPDFCSLPIKLVEILEKLIITAIECDYFSTFFRDLLHFMNKLGHRMSYAVGPALLSDGLPRESRRILGDVLICRPSDNRHPVDDESKGALYLQYAVPKIVPATEKVRSLLRNQFPAKRKKSWSKC